MAQDIVNENQKISYTNLDFSSIYTETLDLIKQLTYKWDPSISDESDPGVILVKLSALIADKCNYNIDKNVLETFPLSVTQEGNARQLYDQLGYYMDWYESSIAPISLTYIGKDFGDKVATLRIPKFTTITDSDNSDTNKRFSLIGVEGVDENIVSDILLTTDGKTTIALAMEGLAVRYQFEGETVITAQMVDPVSRRLYFTTPYISQNGIFIKNTNQENYASWKRVNNLYENSYNELRYVFGYDSNSNTCYLEFPDNYAELFGSGIEITYLVINPDSSDVIVNELSQFLAPITINDDTIDSTLTLDSGTVKLTNFLPSYGHKDVEGLNEAYINYKHTVGTFKTLITLRDYLNYLLSEDLNICSNAFVCDRTNDIQSTYKIISNQHDLDTLLVKVEQLVDKTNVESTFEYKFVLTNDLEVVSDKKYYEIINDELNEIESPSGSPKAKRWYELESIEPDTKDALGPFSLKFYILRKGISLDSKTAYNETFDVLDPYPDFDNLFTETSHLEHIYESLLPLGKNSYIKSQDTYWDPNKSYWRYDTDDNRYELIVDLESYDLSPAENINVYEIDVEALLPHTIFFKEKYPVVMSISTYNVLDTDTQTKIVSNIINSLYSQVNSSQVNFGESISIDYLIEIAKNSDDRIKSVLIDPINYYLSAIYYDDETEKYVSVDIDSDMSNYNPQSYTSKLDIVSALIKKDIVCKSILAGTTQLLVPDKAFIYHLSQKYVDYVDNIANISSEAIIDIERDSTTSYSLDEVNSFIKKSYTLKDNELVSLYRIKLEDAIPFLNGIHYEYILNHTIAEDESYKLRKDEYVILYNPIKDDTNTSIVGYTAYACSNGCIVHPTFEMKANSNTSGLSNFAKVKIIPWFTINPGENYYTLETYNENYKTEIRNNSSIVNNVISGTNSLSIQQPTSINIDANDKYKFFWVLNNPTYPNNKNLKYYTLFNTFDSENDSRYSEEINSYTLREGETFIYLLNDGSDFVTLSAGTTIIRNCGVDSSVYDEIKNSIYFVNVDDVAAVLEDSSIAFFTDTENRIRPRENGLFVAESTDIQPEVLSADDDPLALNLYEKTGNYFTPTFDTEVDSEKNYYKPSFVRTFDQIVDENTTYYLLVMRKQEGWCILSTSVDRDTGIETTAYVDDSIDSDCFEEINIYSLENPTLIDPVELGYYKKASYNSNDYIDIYKLSSELPTEEHNRYTTAADIFSGNYMSTGDEYLEHDSSIINRKILAETDLYSDVDISNISTYTEIDMSKVVPSSPQRLNLLIPTEYRKYYKKNGNNYEEVETSYLTNPYKEGLYIEEDGNYYPTNDPDNYSEYLAFTPEVLSVVPAQNIELFHEEDCLYDTETLNKGYFYKPNKTSDSDLDTKYRFNPDMINSRLIASNAIDTTTQVSPLVILHSLYFYVSANSDYSADDPKWLKAISERWQDVISFQRPYVYASDFSESTEYTYSEICKHNGLYYRCSVSKTTGAWRDNKWVRVEHAWATYNFKDSGSTIASLNNNFENAYVKVSSRDIIDQTNSLGTIYPDWSPTIDTSFITSYFYIPARFYSTFGIAITDHYYIIDTDAGFNYLDNDSKLARLFPNKSIDVSNYGNIQVFYLPKLYKFNDFVRYTYIKYYKPKDLYNKNCGVIDAWSVEALDNDTVAENPIQAIKESWVSLQPNTSLTIIQNEIESFATGDIIMFQANESKETSIRWPKFSNNETILDLDTFRIFYQRKGDDIEELKAINVEDYKWRGYSSLILNTSSKSGQKLEHNHSLTLYSDEDRVNPIKTISGDMADDISFQLKYPVENQAGTFIDVSTTDTLGENIYNSLYAFILYNNGSDYVYNTVNYRTMLYFNSDDSEGEDNLKPQRIDIPVGVPKGNYLLPINMKDEVNLSVKYDNRIAGLVGGAYTTFNIDSPVINSNELIGNLRYKIDPNYIEYLHSYTNDDKIYFEGDRFDYLCLNIKSDYNKINSPSYITQLINLSPYKLGWYKLENGEYIKVGNEYDLIGSNVLETLNPLDNPTEEDLSENPKENGWYERVSSASSIYEYKLTTDTTRNPSKTYYKEPDLYVSRYNTSSVLIFEIDNSSKPLTYVINDIFKYAPNEALGEGFSAIKEKIKRLDNENQYNYAFIPKDNDLIPNPLLPRSFWNKNHVFNKYTIPQLDFDNIECRFITTK